MAPDGGTRALAATEAVADRRLVAPKPAAGQRFWAVPLAVSVLVLAALAIAGVVIYGSAKRSVTSYVTMNLEAVARLKRDQIQHWLEEVEEDLELEVDRRALGNAARRWWAAGMPEGDMKDRVLDVLNRLCAVPQTIECSLHAPDTGALWISNGFGAVSQSVAAQAVRAARAIEPQLEDFNADEPSQPARMNIGFFYGVRDGPAPSAAVAVLHVTIDPTELFSVAAGKWPGLARSVQTALLRQDGTRMPVADPPSRPAEARGSEGSTPASARIDLRAVQAAPIALRGTDERNVAVLAYALPVTGTPWFALTQIDESDAYAELNTLGGLAFGTASALVLLGFVSSAGRRRYQMARERDAQRLKDLSHRLVSVQEQERRRISADLHDRTGANLAAIKLNLSAIAKAAAPGASPTTSSLVSETYELLGDTIAEIRELCADLRPSILDHAGLVAALQSRAQQFSRRTGIDVSVQTDDFEDRFSPEVESMLFRVVQEALTNCAKHAYPSRVVIRLARTAGRVELTVTDDGVGFDPEQLGQPTGAGGLGLATMRERAEFAGGRFALASRLGYGTQIRVELESAMAFAERCVTPQHPPHGQGRF